MKSPLRLSPTLGGIAAAAFCCVVLTSGAASAAISWKRVGTVTTLTNGQLCTNDGTSVYCDSTTPTVAGGLMGIGSTLPVVSLDISQMTDALALPGGSNAQRPTGATLVNGEIRYNNTGTGQVEAYYNGAWNSLVTSATLGTSTPAAGSTGYVQFNSGGYLGASSNFYWDNTNARLGIGVGASPAYQIDNEKIDSSTSGTGILAFDSLVLTPASDSSASQIGQNNIVTMSGSANLTGGLYSVANTAQHYGTGTVANMWASTNLGNNASTGTATVAGGSFDYAANGSTGAITNAYGTFGLVDNGSTGAITNATGLRGEVWNPNAGGTITSAYGLYTNLYNVGTVSNWYGLYVADAGASNPNYFSIYTGSTKSYFGGNVGIGTTSPTGALEVAGKTYLGNITSTVPSSQGVYVYTGNNVNVSQGVDVIRGTSWASPSGVMAMHLLSDGSGNYRGGLGYTSGSGAFTEQMTFLGNGNVGIGTTSPTAPLHVYDAANSIAFQVNQSGATRTLVFGNQGLVDNSSATFGAAAWGGVGTVEAYGGVSPARIGYYFQGAGSQTADAFKYQNSSSTTLAEITASGGGYFAGNVGIGTTSPNNLLDVENASGSSVVQIGDIGTGAYIAGTQLYSGGAVKGSFLFRNSSASLEMDNYVVGPLLFGTSSAERMRIDASGNVGIGTTAPAGTLDVEGGTASSGNGTSVKVYAQNGQASGNTNGGNIVLMPGTANGTGAAGAVGIGSASPATGMKADIAGPVKVAGTGSEPCTASQVGAIRYNPSGNYFELCSYP
jgi:hypothetical protein